jgi:hemolysin activation/secretion protein
MDLVSRSVSKTGVPAQHNGGRSRQSWTGNLAIAVAAAALIAPLPALAQAVPTRDELEGVTRAPPPSLPQLSIAGGIERSPCALSDPQYNDVTVDIRQVNFNNLKGASPAELEPAWRPFVGKPQPVAALCEIRDAAATILRNKGYLAAVEVPTQKIENGQVSMEVLYARITSLRARGETQGAEGKLQEYLNHLTEGEVFNRYEAERYLLLARDLPGYNVQLTLRPAGEGPGELIGEVTVLRQPYTLDFTVQNYAAQATGPWGGQLQFQAFGLTGMGDATTLSYYATSDFKEQHILQAAHEFRPGGEGLVIAGRITHAWTKPDIGPVAGGGGGLKARTLYASLEARYPLVRSVARNVWLGGGFDFIDQDVDFLVPLTEDKLRILWAKASFDAIDTTRRIPAWQARASLEMRQGLDILHASDPCLGAACAPGQLPISRPDGDPTATSIRFEGEFDHLVGKNFAFSLQPRAQYSFDPLLAFEEFTAGNYTVGRGYEPGTLIGDSGLGLGVELRGPRLPFGKAGNVRIQPYAFGDAAWVWNKNVPGSDSLYSAGIGARGDIGDRFRIDTTLAVPLKRTGLLNQRGDVRLLVTLTTRLLPWKAN